MKNIILFTLFVILSLGLSAGFASAAVGVGSWVANNSTIITISNGQSTDFFYGVTALTQFGGKYSIMLYRTGTSTPIRTYAYNVPTVSNGAQGRFTVSSSDYGNTLGSYYVDIRSSDNLGADDFMLDLNVNVPSVLEPFSVTCTANPTTGYVPLGVALTANVNENTPGNSASYSFDWTFGDGAKTSKKVFGLSDIENHNYNTGTFNPSVTATDNGGNSVTANCPTVTSMTPTLSIDNINCFSRVINNNNQSCSVHVTSDSGQAAGNVNINVYYANGALFGSCNTDTISGGCEVEKTVSGVGTYSVYATATKVGFINDTDTYPRYSFDVYSQKYNIINLATYSDSSYLTQSSTFYRGQPLYVKFQVYDPTSNNFVGNDIVTAASLVSLPGGRVDLTRVSYTGNWYYYRLDQIPTTHAFLGNSNVFAFAFNFTDNSGGQSEVNLNILNNNPTISSIPDMYIDIGQTSYLSLNNYGHDVEDSTLQWQISNPSSIVNANINSGNILAVTGLSRGDGTITLKAYDLDNAYAQETFSVHVATGTINNTNVTNSTGLNVICAATPTTGSKPLTVHFSSAVSKGNTPYSYSWYYNDGQTGISSDGSSFHNYNNAGTFNPTLTVTDNYGKIGFANCNQIIVSSSITNVTGVNLGGPYTGYINTPLIFDASATTGSITEYDWTFGDGTAAITSIPTVSHTYKNIDRYSVNLTVKDVNGHVASGGTTATIIEHSSPPPVAPTSNIYDKGLLITGLVLSGGDSGEVLSSNDELGVEITVKSQWTGKLNNIHVVVSIPELGIEAASTSFDLSRGQDQSESVTLPLYDVPPGTYYVQISAGNSDVERIKYREIEITQ